MTVNLGTGKPYSVVDLVHAFERVSEKKIPYEVTTRRKGDVAGSFADPTLAKELLRWEASSDINVMCKDTWRWQQNKINLIP